MFTGILKIYKLKNGKVVDLQGYVLKDGLLIKTIGLSDKATTIKGKLAGARTTQGLWDYLVETYNSTSSAIQDWWNNGGKDCLTDPDVIYGALDSAVASVDCAESVAAAIASDGLGTVLAVVDCGDASVSLINLYNTLENTDGCQVGS